MCHKCNKLYRYLYNVDIQSRNVLCNEYHNTRLAHRLPICELFSNVGSRYPDTLMTISEEGCGTPIVIVINIVRIVTMPMDVTHIVIPMQLVARHSHIMPIIIQNYTVI